MTRPAGLSSTPSTSIPPMSLPPEDQVCRVDDTSSQTSTSATASQTSRPGSTSQTTQSRIAPTARAGINENGDLEARAAALSGRDSQTGITMDVFSVEARTGGQTGVGARMARVGWESDNQANRVAMDVFSARVSGGTRNTDGSRGVNADVSATAVSAQGTVGYSGNSLTGGVSIGVGANASVGIRDQDNDGSSELCVSASLKLLLGVQVGFCVENPF